MLDLRQKEKCKMTKTVSKAIKKQLGSQAGGTGQKVPKKGS